MSQNKEVARISTDPGMLGYVQMLSYELEGLRVLNCQMIRSGTPVEGLYKTFLEEYKTASKRYFSAYHQLVALTAPQYAGPEYQSELSFFSSELIFYRREATA